MQQTLRVVAMVALPIAFGTLLIFNVILPLRQGNKSRNRRGVNTHKKKGKDKNESVSNEDVKLSQLSGATSEEKRPPRNGNLPSVKRNDAFDEEQLPGEESRAISEMNLAFESYKDGTKPTNDKNRVLEKGNNDNSECPIHTF